VSMHADQIDISAETVRELLVSQFPGWAGKPVRRIRASGTVNAIFRIGDGLAARCPLRPADLVATRQTLEQEARASEEFARHSPFPSPIPVAIGDPGSGYPLPWSVQTWLAGVVVSDDDVSGNAEFAAGLAELLTALRSAETGGRRFQGSGRGGDLHDHDRWVDTCLRKSEHLLDVPRLAALWEHFRELPRTTADVMTHGDLIPANVLVADSRLGGILDCGDFGPADPALDVIAGWHLLGDRARAVFFAQLRCDELETERSKAWAFEQAIGAVWYYDSTNPAMSAMGRRTLRRIVASTPL
jgi:aminoglycoside phosphotransferase (APT) family kinase protein